MVFSIAHSLLTKKHFTDIVGQSKSGPFSPLCSAFLMLLAYLKERHLKQSFYNYEKLRTLGSFARDTH